MRRLARVQFGKRLVLVYDIDTIMVANLYGNTDFESRHEEGGTLSRKIEFQMYAVHICADGNDSDRNGHYIRIVLVLFRPIRGIRSPHYFERDRVSKLL